MLSKSLEKTPTRALKQFVPENPVHNLELFRKLVDQIPGQALSAPINDDHPALELRQRLLQFVEQQASLNKSSFYNVDPKLDKGLSVQQAIDCLKDVVRTKRFIQAIDQSIERLAQEKEIVRVLDAGCGPLAVLGIFAALASEKVQCTCLELNPASACFAEVVCGVFGLTERLKIVQADATTYTPNDNHKFDLIISETMFSALIGEPIVQIFNNIHKHLAVDGETLPTRIDYKVGFLDTQDPSLKSKDLVQFGSPTDVRLRHSLDCWETLFSWKPGEELNKIEFKHPLPLDMKTDFHAYVGCDVILGDYKLSGFDSNISWPIPLVNNGRTLKVRGGEDKLLKVSYKPGFRMVNPSATVE